MMLYMLDTNTISYLVRSNPITQQHIQSVDPEQLCISSLTEGELLYGIERRPDATKLIWATRVVLDLVKIMPWGSPEAAQYGALRARQEKMGCSLAPVDMMIAAHALSLGATLVTSDAAFRHVPGLAVEDWR
jgi:tRNA(fMet)-specific endonuclease VapC